MSRSSALRFLALVCGLTVTVSAQRGRTLGPDTAKAILESKVDNAFQTTHINTLVLFPLANAMQFREGAKLVSSSFLNHFKERTTPTDLGISRVIAPDELINFVSANHLDDAFNVFLGDYLQQGSVNASFVSTLKTKLQVDGVLVGKMLAYGAIADDPSGKCGKTGREVGLDMSLYRSSDMRRVWQGIDCISVQRGDDLQQAADVIGEVFARFFGRLPY